MEIKKTKTELLSELKDCEYRQNKDINYFKIQKKKLEIKIIQLNIKIENLNNNKIQNKLEVKKFIKELKEG